MGDFGQISISIQENHGINYSLLKTVKADNRLQLSGGKVDASEWEATCKALTEINDARQAAGGQAIFKTNPNGDSKWHKDYIVYTNQDINFTEEETAKLYKAMGVELRGTSPQPGQRQQGNVTPPPGTEPQDEEPGAEEVMQMGDLIRHNEIPQIPTEEATQAPRPFVPRVPMSEEQKKLINKAKAQAENDKAKAEKAKNKGQTQQTEQKPKNEGVVAVEIGGVGGTGKAKKNKEKAEDTEAPKNSKRAQRQAERATKAEQAAKAKAEADSAKAQQKRDEQQIGGAPAPSGNLRIEETQDAQDLPVIISKEEFEQEVDEFEENEE